MPIKILARLLRCLRRTADPDERRALAAIREANSILAAYSKSWEDVLLGEKKHG